MVEYKDDFVEINGVKLHYNRAGNGDQTLVLLHGASDNGMCWKPTADLLAEEYEVIMPDAQGHGLSDRLGPERKVGDQAHQAAGLIKELGINNPIIMGHSMGGTCTTNVAALYPDLPKAIILEDPGWMTPGEAQPNRRPGASEMRERAEQFKTMTVEELIEQCHRESPLWSYEELVPWAESKKKFDTNLFSSFNINELPWTEMVPKIQCPALLFTAETGIVSDDTVDKAMELWTADKPLSHVKVMGVGHNIRRENFPEFMDTIQQFLKGL
ncbi:MAG: alpha/beta hydrolase [Dehalococcoidales bacterium]|nr:MAG: alpha/beta hydrolase [Dehalococcoidales bacterium]